MTFTKPKRKVKKVFIHCSASDNPSHDNIKTMTEWHLQRGFKTIGYHYFISKDGIVHKGRNIELIPAAQEGNNTGSIAICLHGLDKTKFTTEQFNSLITLCKEINDAYNGDITFHGHCEVANKSCPVFDYKAVLGLKKGGKL